MTTNVAEQKKTRKPGYSSHPVRKKQYGPFHRGLGNRTQATICYNLSILACSNKWRQEINNGTIWHCPNFFLNLLNKKVWM